MSSSLDALIGAVTILLTLSLAVERAAGLFKRRNWQPFRLTSRLWRSAGAEEVNLRTGDAWRQGLPVTDKGLRRRLVRQVNSENTLFIGILLAAVTGANAFVGLPGMQTYAAWMPPWGERILLGLQIAMTGAAGGIGSSFWYDLLSLLIETRRLRSEVTPGAGAPPPAPRFAATRAAALAELPVLRQRPEVLEARLLDVPRATGTGHAAGMQVHVLLKDGSELPFDHLTVQTPFGAEDIPVVAGQP